MRLNFKTKWNLKGIVNHKHSLKDILIIFSGFTYATQDVTCVVFLLQM